MPEIAHDCGTRARDKFLKRGEACADRPGSDSTQRALEQTSQRLARSARLIDQSYTLMDQTEEMIRGSRDRAEQTLKALDHPAPQLLKRAS